MSSRLKRSGHLLLRSICYSSKYKMNKRAMYMLRNRRFCSSQQPIVPKPRRHTREHRNKDGLKRPNRKSTISTEQFGNKSRVLLNLIYFGIKEIAEIDENMTIEYYLHESSELKDEKILNIHVESIGSYQILIDDKKSQITMFSPLSFTNLYIFNEDQQEWQSTLDGHNIIELIARELNDHCKGYPKF